MTATAADVFDRMAEILKDPEHWTRGAFVRMTPDSEPIGMQRVYDGDPAKCFCLEGARRKACFDLGLGREFLIGARSPVAEATERCLIEAAARALDPNYPIDSEPDPDTIWFYNDDPVRTHAEVLDVIAAAKAICSKETT